MTNIATILAIILLSAPAFAQDRPQRHLGGRISIAASRLAETKMSRTAR